MAPFYCADCKQFYCQNCWNDFHLGEGNETRSGHKHLMRVGDQSNNLISTDDRNIRQVKKNDKLISTESKIWRINLKIILPVLSVFKLLLHFFSNFENVYFLFLKM